MSPLRRAAAAPAAAGDVAVPAGVAVLHLFARLRADFDATAFASALAGAEENGIQALTFAVLGHKAQVGVMLLGPELWALRATQAAVETTGLDLVGSYLSITEISEYAEALPEVAKRHRLHPVLPPDGARVLAFYPMSKRRGVDANWYALDFDERFRLMHDHGRHGRRHAGKVVQLVTASTGLDDWEWGVTLFATEPTALKDVVYELRYDEVSARYADFGPFIVGLLCAPPDLGPLCGADGS
ncbi:MAG: chlorite dismutase family protein [Actinomycetota bacterium]|nr:chlorite dismutase family protein [Actinomycetota bacterium]